MSENQPSNPSIPSPAAVSGRQPGGKFAPGNKLGKGNPNNRRAQQIRSELLKASTRADVKVIVRQLIDSAKLGDLAFIREFLDRTIGKPANTELLERIEKLEEQFNQGTK